MKPGVAEQGVMEQGVRADNKEPEGMYKGMDKGNAAVSWTGGKDGCYSCFRAMQEGYKITALLSFRNISRVGSHEINPGLIRAQSEAIGVPLHQKDFSSYELEFKKTIQELRARGERIDAAVFGHIQTHKMLVDRICSNLDLKLLLPLWKQDSGKIIKDIIDSGFEVIIVSVKDSLLGKEWLGRRIDEKFIDDLREANISIDPCGENGEFHTFVADGPLFNKRIVIKEGKSILREGYWFLNIDNFCLRDK